MGPKVVSPSTIARYYFHECDRFLRYTATPSAERAGEGVPKPPYDTSPITHAILDSGYVWEEEVVGRLIARTVEVAVGDGPVRERVHSAEGSRRLIANLRPGHHIYQPTLQTPPSFYGAYGIDPALVRISDCRPDLIECYRDDDGTVWLRVIDVKASPGLKLSHRIQATIYTLLLEHCLTAWGVQDRRVSYEPAIWLVDTSAPEAFDVRAMKPPLEDFLSRELVALMSAPASEAAWHVYFRCEWCEWFRHCRSEMKANDDLSRIPYLSSHAKQFLRALPHALETVGDLNRFLASNDGQEIDDCASLRGAQDRLRAQTNALLKDRIAPYGSASLSMPRGENVRIVLSLQREPVSGHLYAWGIQAQGLKDIVDGGRLDPMVDVAAASDANVLQQLEREFVRRLHEILQSVDGFNWRNADWRAQKSLQVYVYDSYESDLLTELLQRALLDAEVAEQALELFFHFQEPELLEAEDHPSREVFFPIVTLVHVLQSVIALPIEVSYRFGDAVRLLQPSQYPFLYREDSLFTFTLSNQVRSDAIFQVWHRGRDDLVPSIRREILQRLRATGSLINGIREALDGTGALFAWPPKFRFAGRMGFHDQLLSRLSFLARYESALGYLGLRQTRMAPLQQRLRAGDALRITYRGDGDYRLDPMHTEIEIEAGGFPNWLLVADSPVGHSTALLYHDYANRSRVWVPKDLDLALAGVHQVVGTEDGGRRLALELKAGRSTTPPQDGADYVLLPRFTDFNTERCLAELMELDAEPGQRYSGLLRDPGRALGASEMPASIRQRVIGLGAETGMTASQRHALTMLTQRNLLLVWGPPGTGKTHFLAHMILTLATAHHEAGRPLHVLVSAFTHAAIDNCLRQLAAATRQHRLLPAGLRIAKLGRTHLPDMAGVLEIADEAAGHWLNETPLAVVGGTSWAFRKGIPPSTIDLLVLDEGSQMKPAEAAIPFRRLRAGGAMVVAGDDRQLPPIVQGQYPDPAPGEPILHRSLFECLRRPDWHGHWTATLLENWRMNETLCRYPAEQVYVPDYRSATQEIAGRRLPLSPANGSGSLADMLIDPDHPLVIGVLDGVRAAAENRIEAGLVSAAATMMRARLPDVVDDADFWRHRLFIVSPHHAQIHAIRRRLRAEREWTAEPFVDTVDRMQGQECDAVIVSYGVSDVEYALQEAAFIYGLNRLNVAITRARAKTIVFLPRPLIEPPIRAYEDETIAEGVAFMQGLVQFAQRNGETSEHPLEGGVARLTLHRVAASRELPTGHPPPR